MNETKFYPYIAVTALCMVIYHLANCYFNIFGTLEHRMIHLGFAITLVSMTAHQLKGKPLIRAVLIFTTLICLIYLKYNLQRLLLDIGFPLTRDMIISFAILVVVFIGAWLSFGPILPLMVIILMCYGYFGHYIGGPILSIEEIMSTVCLTFGGYDLWGTILIISANVIFLFVFYGHMLQHLRATDSFMEVGKLIGRYTRSGAAMTGVISSFFMGMTTGQATPNIAVTGAFTIPLMKRVGYKAEVAASIEAAASGGGQIMPPIMGAGAFVMAELLSVPYSKIIMVALIPGILYFFAVAMFVHFQAIKSNVTPLREKVDRRRLTATAPLFIIPLVIILVLLFLEFPPMVSAFWGIVTLVGLSFVRKNTRPSISHLIKGCIYGAVTGSRVALACATLGPIIALVTKTGLGIKVGYSVELWSGGNLFLGLIILMISVIILGLEVPTVAAYLIAAMVAIPALTRLGLDPFQAHMFAFYFGAFSGLTPPVGMAAIVASKIANASYFRTAILSMYAAVAGFVIPYLFVFNGSLLLLPGSTVISVMSAVAFTIMALAALEVGLVGCLFSRLTAFQRLLSIGGSVGFMIFVATGKYAFLIGAVVIAAFIIIFNFKKTAANKLAYPRISA